MIVREMLGKPHLGSEPIAFLDDDPHKQKMWIHGLPVLGGLQDMDRVIRTFRPSCVIIAMPTAPGEVIQEISSTCDLLQVEKKIVPGISQILDGRVHVGQLRDVDIQDLLRREPVRTDIDIVRHTLAGRRVLVTGGGGSFARDPVDLLDQVIDRVVTIHTSDTEAYGELRHVLLGTGATPYRELLGV
jgi:FlaA1/EpsC-like NDP-sugar epimerase